MHNPGMRCIIAQSTYAEIEAGLTLCQGFVTTVLDGLNSDGFFKTPRPCPPKIPSLIPVVESLYYPSKSLAEELANREKTPEGRTPRSVLDSIVCLKTQFIEWNKLFCHRATREICCPDHTVIPKGISSANSRPAVEARQQQIKDIMALK